tara:strand:+ start:422 stop:1168 length:747 start_codon:yes stop_codon:yes gene_type:complete
MPSNWENYLPDLNNSRPPQLVFDQEEKALVADLRKIDTKLSYGAYPTETDRAIFSESLIGGDSGNPAFLIVDPDPNNSNVSSELVLNYVLTFGGTGTGTSLANSISLLNSTIAGADADASARSETSTINTGYTVTEADFSYYTDYSLPTEEIVVHPVGVGTTSTHPVGVGTTSAQQVGVGTTSTSEEVHIDEEVDSPPEEVEPSPEQLNIRLERNEIYLLAAGVLILYFVLKAAGFFSAFSKYLDNGL